MSECPPLHDMVTDNLLLSYLNKSMNEKTSRPPLLQTPPSPVAHPIPDLVIPQSTQAVVHGQGVMSRVFTSAPFSNVAAAAAAAAGQVSEILCRVRSAVTHCIVFILSYYGFTVSLYQYPVTSYRIEFWSIKS